VTNSASMEPGAGYVTGDADTELDAGGMAGDTDTEPEVGDVTGDAGDAGADSEVGNVDAGVITTQLRLFSLLRST
jgi:hypothetical protein